MITEPAPQHLGVVVAGAGFGGLAAAHALKGRGEDFAGDYLRRVAREHGLLPPHALRLQPARGGLGRRRAALAN